MADHGRVEYASAPGNDYAEHEATYSGVMNAAKHASFAILGAIVALGIYNSTGSHFLWGLLTFATLVFFGLGAVMKTIKPGAGWLVFLLVFWALIV